MRICVFGAGAVGGHFAVRLAVAGHDVAVVARGPHLAAIRERGLTLRSGGDEWRARIKASDDPAQLGEQDAVLVTVKAHQLPAFAALAQPLLRPDSAVIFAQNGIPWWYADGLTADDRFPPDLAMLDPGDLLRRAIGVERTLGGVIYSSNDQAEPGVIVNNSPARNRLLIGEVDDAQSPRVSALRAVLDAAGIASPAVAQIRQPVWDKLVANLSVSILSFLGETSSRNVFEDAWLRPVADRLGGEAIAIAAAYGYRCERDAKGPAGHHKSSLLQDYERGRPPEFAALLDAPLALGRAAGGATPVLETIAALAHHKSAARSVRGGAIDC